MSRNPNSQSLLAFLAVAEEGSINAAAERLHVSQPALTRTVRDLEEQFGLPLFARDHKGVCLTPFGERMLIHARRLRAELDALDRSARSYKQGQRGRITIGAAPVPPVALVAKAITDLQRAHDIEVQVVIGSQLDMIEALRRGDIDLFMGPLLTHGDKAGLIQETVNFEETAFYCRGDHPLAGQAGVRAADLGAAGWVLGARGTTLRTQIETYFEQHGVELDVRVETEDVNLRRSIVAQSDLVSAFQTHHVFRDIGSGVFARLDYPGPLNAQPIGCIRVTAHTAESRSFMDLLISHYKAAGLA